MKVPFKIHAMYLAGSTLPMPTFGALGRCSDGLRGWFLTGRVRSSREAQGPPLAALRLAWAVVRGNVHARPDCPASARAP